MVKLELSLRARNLQNVAGVLKGTSDPFAVVTKIATSSDEKPEVLGQTEVIKNTLDPEWVKIFTFDYQLGSQQKLAITLFDEVQKGENRSMGAVIFDVGTLLGSRGGTQGKKTKGGGKLYAHVRKSKGSGQLTLQLAGNKLKNTEGFGVFRKSDPFFELRRKTDGGDWDNVYRSDHVKNNLSPEWEESTIELSALCDGELDASIQLCVYDHEKSGDHELMSVLETSVTELLTAGRENSELDLGGNGTIKVRKATLSGPTFVDYVAGGCQINVVVAIDFTGSNGDPRQEGTLHYFHQEEGKLNDYEKAVSSTLGVLSKYDHDKKFPVLGFGAKYDGEVKHAFQVGDSEELEGIDGVLEAYKNVFRTGLIMSGPTVITEVIEVAAAKAESSLEAALENGSQAYTVLVIVTDGCVSDQTSTIKCVLDTSDKPLSIVIIGVGDEDFSKMEFLDDLRRRGKRDITQFICFNEHNKSAADLTSATLSEIPEQLETFFLERGIQPTAAIEVEEEEIAIPGEEEEEPEIDLTLEFLDEEIVVSGGGNGVQGW